MVKRVCVGICYEERTRRTSSISAQATTRDVSSSLSKGDRAVPRFEKTREEVARHTIGHMTRGPTVPPDTTRPNHEAWLDEVSKPSPAKPPQ